MLNIDSNGNIELTRGDTAKITVTIMDSVKSTEYVMNEHDILTISIKKSIKDADYSLQKASEGTNTFKIDPSDTKNLDFGKYIYDIQLTTDEGEVYTVVPPSNFVLAQEVT